MFEQIIITVIKYREKLNFIVTCSKGDKLIYKFYLYVMAIV